MAIFVRSSNRLRGRIKRAAVRALVRALNIYPGDLQVTREYAVRGVTIKVHLGNVFEVWRWDEMASGAKEPQTLDWIDTEMRPGEVFVDIGACVGNYAIYAALRHRGLQAFAIEPEPNSFVELVKNVMLNDLSVRCFLVPLAGRATIDFFHCYAKYAPRAEQRVMGHSYFIAGESEHQFGRAIDSDGNPFVPTVSIGMSSITLDAMVRAGVVAPPHHIKIDVDGLELEVLEGMEDVLASNSLRTVLCEASRPPGRLRKLIERFEEKGFRCVREPRRLPGNCLFRRDAGTGAEPGVGPSGRGVE